MKIFQPVYMICVWMTIINLLERQRSKGKVQEKEGLNFGKNRLYYYLKIWLKVFEFGIKGSWNKAAS